MTNWWWHATGRRWRRPPRTCPDWCGSRHGREHLCTARYGYPSGEHRSPPLRVVTSWGVLVATRVQGISDPASRLEVRLQVDLAHDEQLAHAQAAQVAAEVDLAVQCALTSAAAGWLDVDELDLLGLPGGDR